MGMASVIRFVKLHLLATSRQELDIARASETLVSHDVPMDGSLVDRDIRVHVPKTLDHDDEFRMHSAEERKLVETALTGGAHGM